MIITKHDAKYKYISTFNTETGFYARTGIIENGVDTGVDPFMSSFPELIDVGVMETCVCAKYCNVDCYQKAIERKGKNMSVENFEKIMKEASGKMFQCAMGGAGDVDTHENFEDLLKICKKYCGAVAVSEHHAPYTKRAVNLLLNAGVKTNIHYVLSNNSIDEAITRIENNDFPKGINAVIFLLYKPVGLGTREKVLHTDDPRVKRFFEAIENVDHNFKIGFDSCTVPALINYTTKVNPDSFDTCEGGRWSMYITSDMKALPCSFDNQGMKWSYDISDDTIENAWNSDIFENFRNYFRYSCPNCKRRRECMGGCPITREIVLCDKTEKDEVICTK